VETLYLPSRDTDIKVDTVYRMVILYIQNVDNVISEWRGTTVRVGMLHRVEILDRLVTLYSQSGDTIEKGDTVQGGVSTQSRDTIQSGDTTVAVETLYGQSTYTIHSEWRQYTVRVDTLYIQSRDNMQSE